MLLTLYNKIRNQRVPNFSFLEKGDEEIQQIPLGWDRYRWKICGHSNERRWGSQIISIVNAIIKRYQECIACLNQ